jgi:mono/diheme cytochrome c family protein
VVESNERILRELVMKQSFLMVAMLFLSMSAVAAPPDGKALFQENCATCHGQSGQGGVGPKLVGDASEWKTKLFERAVLSGIDDEGKALKPPMPHWKDASFKSDKGAAPGTAEVDAIQRYLRTLK